MATASQIIAAAPLIAREIAKMSRGGQPARYSGYDGLARQAAFRADQTHQMASRIASSAKEVSQFYKSVQNDPTGGTPQGVFDAAMETLRQIALSADAMSNFTYEVEQDKKQRQSRQRKNARPGQPERYAITLGETMVGNQGHRAGMKTEPQTLSAIKHAGQALNDALWRLDDVK